jgi:hypothetical protein
MSSDTRGSNVLADALNLTMSEMVFRDANDLFEQRLRMLGKFTRASLPDSLVSKAATAVDLTRNAHAACSSLLSVAQRIVEQPKDSVSLFAIAALALENDEAATGADIETKERNGLARGYFLSAVVSELRKEKSDKTLKDILDECVVGTDELMSLALTIQATLLAAKHSQLTVVAETLPQLATLGLIWRGLFYAAVIGKAGGSLEKELARQKIMDTVADASSKVLGVVPGVGEMFDIAKTLINLYSAMRHKEEHIDELVQQIESAQEYIDTYQEALLMWATSAISIQDTIILFMKSFGQTSPGRPPLDAR